MNFDPTDVRLSALDALDILDTESEPEFDDIVLLASMICKTPVALVSLVERHRQWFKAAIGFEGCETPIEQSVCAHALESTATLIIPDLTLDARTKANTLVTEGPRIHFYAGAPLVLSSGVIIGTLCVIDDKARPEGLSAQQQRGLEALARQVIILLEARENSLRKDDLFKRQKKLASNLREIAGRTIAAQEAGGIGTFEVDIASGEMQVSAQFCRIFDVPISPTYSTSFFEAIVHPEDRDVASNPNSRADGSAAQSVEYRIVTVKQGIRWIARDAAFVPDNEGFPTRMLGTVQDVTEAKRAEADQDVRNHELSHRMKNMFAMVQAIASQTLRPVEEKSYVRALGDRLRALSTAHDILLRKSWTSATIVDIVDAAVLSLGLEERIEVAGPEVSVGPRAALNLSLLLNELATNALKYGALSTDGGGVEIGWRIDGRGNAAVFHLRWHEHGGPLASEPKSTGFGSRLISMGLLGTGGVSARYNPAGPTVDASAPFLDLQRPTEAWHS